MTKTKKTQSSGTSQPAPTTTPSTPPPKPLVVGIGASAGGLKALEAFFKSIPVDRAMDMAFVVVQHLDPDHKSFLSDLVSRYSHLKTLEAVDGLVVEPNCVYIIPPNKDMGLINGQLQLFEPQAPRGTRLPIDFFFRSLAQDAHDRAVGIILSGTGSDGTAGIRMIKGEGGLVLAQSPDTTEHDGMPRHAIDTGLVDFVQAPELMPAQLLSYAAQAFGSLPRQDKAPDRQEEDALKKIFLILRGQTTHDFSQYKPNTIRRRIERRMAMQQIDRLEAYLRFLQQNRDEVAALFQDLLIGVTMFFRDPDCFSALHKLTIRRLVSEQPAGSLIRVWVPACSTGEEAYSIAMLFQEEMQEQKTSLKIQIFGTDIDPQAIAHARAGIYPASITTDVSADRLRRFFDHDAAAGTFRVQKALRDMIVFSTQDVIKDPPFSRLDLISCRNLLIYMGPELQKRLLPLFHYALNPGGVLFLGNAETTGDGQDLFTPLDRKSKIYQRQMIDAEERRASPRLFATPSTNLPPPTAGRALASGPVAKLSWRELTEHFLLLQTGLTGALVSETGEVLYLHGRTGRFLEPSPGEAAPNNILKMARDGLKGPLIEALAHAARRHETVVKNNVHISNEDYVTHLNLTVRPVPPTEETKLKTPAQFLIVFEEIRQGVGHAPLGLSSSHSPPVGEDSSPEFDSRLFDLREQLRSKEEYLISTNEELETSNEELKSANEEMQSMNEELQSTNEELETSKEELQSVNEELATVNTELQAKVASLTQLNNDMNNLLSGTGVGTIFVDPQMRIQRFTPAVTQIVPLIQTDVGRPLGNIVANIPGYKHLMDDAREVLDTLIPKELEIRTHDGQFYLLRIRPYRTLGNVIEGVVITFVDISSNRRAQTASMQAEASLRLLFDATPLGVIFHDGEGRITDANTAAEKMLGWSVDQLRGFSCNDTRWGLFAEDGTSLPPERHPVIRAIQDGEPVMESVLGIRSPFAGDIHWVSVNVIPQNHPDEKRPYRVCATLRPVNPPQNEVTRP